MRPGLVCCSNINYSNRLRDIFQKTYPPCVSAEMFFIFCWNIFVCSLWSSCHSNDFHFCSIAGKSGRLNFSPIFRLMWVKWGCLGITLTWCLGRWLSSQELPSKDRNKTSNFALLAPFCQLDVNIINISKLSDAGGVLEYYFKSGKICGDRRDRSFILLKTWHLWWRAGASQVPKVR